MKAELTVVLIFLRLCAQAVPLNNEKEKNPNCIDMTPERVSEIERLGKEVNGFLRELTDKHEDIDLTLVTVNIENHSEDDDEKETTLKVVVNDCKDSEIHPQKEDEYFYYDSDENNSDDGKDGEHNDGKVDDGTDVIRKDNEYNENHSKHDENNDGHGKEYKINDTQRSVDINNDKETHKEIHKFENDDGESHVQNNDRNNENNDSETEDRKEQNDSENDDENQKLTNENNLKNEDRIQENDNEKSQNGTTSEFTNNDEEATRCGNKNNKRKHCRKYYKKYDSKVKKHEKSRITQDARNLDTQTKYFNINGDYKRTFVYAPNIGLSNFDLDKVSDACLLRKLQKFATKNKCTPDIPRHETIPVVTYNFNYYLPSYDNDY